MAFFKKSPCYSNLSENSCKWVAKSKQEKLQIWKQHIFAWFICSEDGSKRDYSCPSPLPGTLFVAESFGDSSNSSVKKGTEGLHTRMVLDFPKACSVTST